MKLRICFGIKPKGDGGWVGYINMLNFYVLYY